MISCGKASAGDAEETIVALANESAAGAHAVESNAAGSSAIRPSAVGPSEVARLREELDQCRQAAEDARTSDAARIQSLETKLEGASADRARREKEWLAYTQTITKLGDMANAPSTLASGDPALERAAQSSAAIAASAADPSDSLTARGTPSAQPSSLSSPAAIGTGGSASGSGSSASGTGSSASSARKAEKQVATLSPAEMRDHEIFVTLRSLFMVEQVGGYDLLESGALHGVATGPVVMRVLDDRGHPLGTLYAERLRLEASRAARTLTLVLEDGYERVGATRAPFPEVPRNSSGTAASAVAPTPPTLELGSPGSSVSISSTAAPSARNARRMLLPDVDPRAWIEALPELFGPEAKEPPPDDGRWDLGVLRAALNDLLRLDSSGGFYRVKGFSGVQGDSLRDVQIDGLDREGRLERKLFADRMRIAPADQGVLILLEGGAQMRGDEKTPFLDGRYRIFLPRANLEEWRKAVLPGLSPAPDPKKR